MKNARNFEVVTRDLRKQEAAAKKLIASVHDFRPTSKTTVTLATVASILTDVESVLRETAALRDELSLNQFNVEAKFVARADRSLAVVTDVVLAAANRVVVMAKPVAPLGNSNNIIDAIQQALDMGTQKWIRTDTEFASNDLTSLMVVTFDPMNDDASGEAPSALQRLSVMVSANYPDTNYVPATARYAMSVLYGSEDIYAWEASAMHASMRIDLGAYNRETGFRAISAVANRLAPFDVSMEFQRKPTKVRGANELRPDDICGLQVLPIKVINVNAHDHTVTVGLTLHGDLRATTLLALSNEIKRRMINTLPVMTATIGNDSTIALTFSPSIPLETSVARLEQIAGHYDTQAA